LLKNGSLITLSKTKSKFKSFIFLSIKFNKLIFLIFRKIEGLKSDFLPYICKKQFSVTKRHLKEISQELNTTGGGAGGTGENNTAKTSSLKSKLYDHIKQDETNYLINKMSSNKLNHDAISVYAFIQADGFCYRSNNIAIYAEANRQLMSKIMPYYQHKERTESVGKHEKSQVVFFD
jgi:hypothetical protein